MTEPTAGGIAPDFSLPRDGGGTVALGEFAGKAVVVYFYPQDDTKSCTAEAIDFSALSPEFAAAGAAIVGISPDAPARHDRFKAKYGLSVVLAADEARTVIEAYGAWGEKSLYGRRYMGVIRSTVLIGRDGRIARIWRNVRVRNHAIEVLEAVKAL
jgi:peroxiredoxin Q/BCP